MANKKGTENQYLFIFINMKLHITYVQIDILGENLGYLYLSSFAKSYLIRSKGGSI